MKKWEVLLVAGCFSLSTWAETTNKMVTLTASKDNTVRSNEILNNNGGNPKLYIVGVPYIRTIIAFDLKQLVPTNKIEQATILLHFENTNDKLVSFVVAPMVQTTNNNAWGEGVGNLGVQGQKANTKESTFIFSAAHNTPWESSNGKTVSTITDASLWQTPVATFKNSSWKKDDVLRITLDPKWLESIRNSNMKTITFGLWGSSGDGYYFLSSRESNFPPKLQLTLEKDKEVKKAPTPPQTAKEK